MTRTGTNHFTSLDKAVSYYKVYGYDRGDVLEMWRKLEICIGQPLINENQDFYADSDGRYWIFAKN